MTQVMRQRLETITASPVQETAENIFGKMIFLTKAKSWTYESESIMKSAIPLVTIQAPVQSHVPRA